MANKMFKTSTGSMHFALFIIRVGFGIVYMLHGWPKISGGPGLWENLGGNMSVIGFDFIPVFWGFMAAAAEFLGGLFLILGLLTRPAALLMLITMLVATLMHIQAGDAINTILHPLKGLVVFVALFFSGAGKYSVDNMLSR